MIATKTIHTVHYESNWLRYLGRKIWKKVPTNIKKLGSVKTFKFAIKRWIPETAPGDSANGMSTQPSWLSMRF